KDQVTFAGEEGTTLSNVANGAVVAGGMDAVNGGQLYGALDSTAQMLGGGAAVTAFGTLSAPTYMVQGASYFSVGDAFGAVDAQISLLGQRLNVLESATPAPPAVNGRVAVGGAPDGGDRAAIGESTDAVAIGSNAAANSEN